MLTLAAADPYRYTSLVQEDRFIEWWTVGLLVAAAAVRLRGAVPRRRVFDLLVALFCLFMAGEEFSWGQRLLGFTPPAAFLEHNTQQELTLHNFADVFGKPKGVFILALLGYGVCLPLVARLRRTGRVMEALGATVPPSSTVPWFAAAAGLLFWYPVDYTGEWVEALAAALFLVSALPLRRTLAWSTGASALAAAGLTLLTAPAAASSPAALACARGEVRALLADAAAGAATPRLLRRSGSAHKRVWTAGGDGYIDLEALSAFRSVACEGPRSHERTYLVDPWGMAYWIRVDRAAAGARRVAFYSFGPNRRRDHAAGAAAKGDDIIASGVLPALD